MNNRRLIIITCLFGIVGLFSSAYAAPSEQKETLCTNGEPLNESVTNLINASKQLFSGQQNLDHHDLKKQSKLLLKDISAVLHLAEAHAQDAKKQNTVKLRINSSSSPLVTGIIEAEQNLIKCLGVKIR